MFRHFCYLAKPMKRSLVNPNKRLRCNSSGGVESVSSTAEVDSHDQLRDPGAQSSQRETSMLPVKTQLGQIEINGHIYRSESLASLTSRASYDRVMDKIIKSPNDKKDYRVLKLDNGLTALLISDPSPEPSDSESDTKEEEIKKDGSPAIANNNVEDQNDSPMEEDEEDESDDDEDDDDDSDENDEDEDSSDESSDSDIDDDKNEAPSPKAPKKKKVVLTEKMSAVALCIGVGSFSDPLDIPGLGHFLEHMVFMGSEKYPDENDFDAFVKKHGGQSNAYTDCERTVFYFDIKKEFLRGGLDRFAQFFISPLMKRSSVDREIEAVDSEFSQCLPSDKCRVEQLICSLSKPNHPMGKFMWGNAQTLRTLPAEQGIDVYTRLQEFHRRMYSAHYMTLAIQSRDSLDNLESMVTEIFSDVVKNDLPKPTFYDLKDPFDQPAFYKLYKVSPIKKLHQLCFTWCLPPQLEHYKVKPLHYIGWLVGHEGKGSILSYLKKKVWALDLYAGNGESGLDHNSTWAEFQVCITLTEQGMIHVDEVMNCVFEYLSMLTKLGPQERIFREIQTIEDNSFRWREEGEPVDYVDDLCVNMQLYPPEHYITGDQLLMEYDPQVIDACQKMLVPRRVNITMISSHFTQKNICDQKETWFQTPYKVEDIPEEWLVHWETLEPNPEFHLPAENTYIATDFIMKIPDAPVTKFPVLVTDDAQSKLWYKKDTKFDVPKAHVYFYILNENVNKTPYHATISDLYITILLHNLAEVAYAADVALLNYHLKIFENGIIVKVWGFNHKLSKLFQTIIDHMADFQVSEELFSTMKRELQKAYHNDYIRPAALACELRLSVLQHNYWTMVERQNQLPVVTREAVMDFAQHTLGKECFVEGLVQGNYLLQDAKEFENYLLEKLKCTPIPSGKIPEIRVTEIPEGQVYLRVKGFNMEDGNSVIENYYQHGPAQLHHFALHNLLMMRMEEPCFDILRTREQLGYNVYNSLRNTNGILGFIIHVKSQANKHSLAALDNHVENFLLEFGEMVENLTEHEFHTQVSSLVTLKMCEDTGLKEEADRHWSEIATRTYLFDILDREVQELQSLTLPEFKEWFRQHTAAGGHCRKYSIQVQGNAEITSKRSLKKRLRDKTPGRDSDKKTKDSEKKAGKLLEKRSSKDLDKHPSEDLEPNPERVLQRSQSADYEKRSAKELDKKVSKDSVKQNKDADKKKREGASSKQSQKDIHVHAATKRPSGHKEVGSTPSAGKKHEGGKLGRRHSILCEVVERPVLQYLTIEPDKQDNAIRNIRDFKSKLKIFPVSKIV